MTKFRVEAIVGMTVEADDLKQAVDRVASVGVPEDAQERIVVQILGARPWRAH